MASTNYCVSGAVVDLETFVSKAEEVGQKHSSKDTILRLKKQIDVLKEANERQSEIIERMLQEKSTKVEDEVERRCRNAREEHRQEVEELRTLVAVLKEQSEVYRRDFDEERAARVDTETRMQTYKRKMKEMENRAKRTEKMFDGLLKQLTFIKNATQTFITTDISQHRRGRGYVAGDIEEDGEGDAESYSGATTTSPLTCSECAKHFVDGIDAMAHTCGH